MKDVLIGLVIIVFCFLVIDFLYTEKNTCTVNKLDYNTDNVKCGFIKKQFNVDIYIFGRLW